MDNASTHSLTHLNKCCYSTITVYKLIMPDELEYQKWSISLPNYSTY